MKLASLGLSAPRSLGPSVIVSGTLEVLDLVWETTERRDPLEENTLFWRKGLTEAGFDIKAGASPIVPAMLYDAKLAGMKHDILGKTKVEIAARYGLWRAR